MRSIATLCYNKIIEMKGSVIMATNNNQITIFDVANYII
ncbi:hypothetical protein AshY1_02430 [Candidatus Phytoplasma fraxini]|uniref:Uncharacterized protein n=1 Tax=Ash yellows phytoplasma TaxID=35780 RepID=A0ABZ2U7Z7_ASHYP